MALLLHFFFGFSTSFLGMITPGMLNMTAVRISLEKSRKDALKFTFGVSLVVFAQAYLAVLFTRYFSGHPSFIETLKKIAAVVFLFLSIYFYRQYRRNKDRKDQKEKIYKNSFKTGLTLSLLNMFAIPFYYWVTTVLDVAGVLQFSPLYIFFFVTGSTSGTFLLLNTYSKYARRIQIPKKRKSNDINLILSILTGLISILTLFKILSQ
jgi:threonine/homoserine/homoserine lactone efflux protein